MNILLDTHALLWWLDESPKLSATGYDAIRNASLVLASAASAYELAIKFRLGKLKIPQVFVDDFDGVMFAQGLAVLPISARHASVAGALPLFHRDPFDRILAAQAKVEKLTLLTADRKLAAFNVDIFW